MKNKMLAAVLAGMLALGAVACGGGDDTGTTDTGGGGTATEGVEVTS